MDEGPPNIEFRVTWTASGEGEPVQQGVSLIADRARLRQWKARMESRYNDFTITKLEDRILPGWETVPFDSWPEGVR